MPKILKPAFIGIEGPIAAGKSTLAKRIASALGFTFIEELDDKTNPFLGRFYDEVIGEKSIKEAGEILAHKVLAYNPEQLSAEIITGLFEEVYQQMPKEIAIKMQWFLLVHRYLQHFSANVRLVAEGEGSVIDRTINGDTVFVKMLVESGKISQEDAELTYFKAFDAMLLNLTLPDLVIYLDVTAEVALERCIKLRGRSVEGSMTIEYLNALKKGYEALLKTLQGKVRILRLDWNNNRDIENGNINDVIERIKEELPDKIVGS